ncbi:MAG: hypothetical protein LBS50_11055 [Prevotellaceae bacterium]|jgi:hypothetical protein|nr:hypothetical protein [Prevotellaceae bacterium]
MKRVFIGVIALMAFGFNCFAQNVNVIKKELTLNEETKIKHTLNLKPPTKDVQITISLKWEKPNKKDIVHITFIKNEYENKYICLFPEKLTFKVVKKTLSIKFDKNFRKQMKNDGEGKSVQKYSDDCAAKKTIIANLKTEDIALSYSNCNADNKKLNFELTAYLAIKSKKKKKILYKTVIPFNLTLVDQSKELKDNENKELKEDKCKESKNSINDLVEQIQNIKEEKNAIDEKIKELRNLSCKDLQTCSLTANKKEERKAQYPDCSEHTAKVKDLNTEIKKYNNSIEQYNSKRNALISECNKCSCNCKVLENLLGKEVGPLLWKLQSNQIDKNTARNEFKRIKKSLGCYDDCKKCKYYQKFKDDCDRIEKLLK